ncbi:uncharacterized protein EKO05_0003517 [Ascochyta rabiei]|uniref:Uncharacterized protein n=1 Tax=Didymella rabiei TaxID=5454 RepID=A0A163GCZ1_DIDRA|nr:uncharacterized protein EKO05_0003517 [Ascochyta rabiei]KZM24801.1 hypothetical protein ST47_g4031 [Ascochyta rabiei]UPX12987.1 hypothetical protein EKO05_0003517 [Ascochyta rabiei]
MTGTPPHRPRLPTPTLSSSPTSPVIDYSPHTVPYNESFENELMTAILQAPTTTTPPQPRRPLATDDTRMISASDLPVPLNSPLRTHPSPVPGLLLTHEKGYHTGGIGPSAHVVNEFAARFIAERKLEAGDVEGLERAVQREVQSKLEVVKERMRERERAFDRNKGVERELGDLRLQRQAELRVMERVKGKR